MWEGFFSPLQNRFDIFKKKKNLSHCNDKNTSYKITPTHSNLAVSQHILNIPQRNNTLQYWRQNAPAQSQDVPFCQDAKLLPVGLNYKPEVTDVVMVWLTLIGLRWRELSMWDMQREEGSESEVRHSIEADRNNKGERNVCVICEGTGGWGAEEMGCVYTLTGAH